MILGIMGGMGPAATLDLMKKITGYSHASKDQEHIHLVIDSNTQIPDRSEYISGNGENPVYEMVRSAIRLEMMGADYIVIPCNTAHLFCDRILKYSRVPIINMVNETAEFINRKHPDAKDFFLLATEGTYASGIYKKAFEKFELNVTEPEQKDKQTVMNWIHKVKSGDFSVSPLEVKTLIEKYTKMDEPIILGCTELPLLATITGTPKEYIDPASVLARRCVEIAEKSRQFTDEKQGQENADHRF